MENASGYQYGNKALNIPDVSGNALIEWLENVRRLGIEMKVPYGEGELLYDIITKVKEMQDQYYKAIVEC